MMLHSGVYLKLRSRLNDVASKQSRSRTLKVFDVFLRKCRVTSPTLSESQIFKTCCNVSPKLPFE